MRRHGALATRAWDMAFTSTGAMIDEMHAKHAKDYAHCP